MGSNHGAQNGDPEPPRRYDDPSTKIWSVYLNQAEKADSKITESWKGDMDAILIFAGLFSASVTAFIIESYKTLVPDNSDTTVVLLAQIYQQLSNGSSLQGIPSVVEALDSSSFSPPTSALTCNILWFLSLGFSLTAALSATLVQQWTRNYIQATSSCDIPHQRARICAYLYQGLKRFHMNAIVGAIPVLLHLSLLLFFAGLVEFLRPVNIAISYMILGTLLVCGMLYCLITVLPLLHLDCPYHTPLTTLWWKILQALHLIRRRNSHGGFSLVLCSMAEARELDATDTTFARDERDFSSICWAVESLRDDSDLEPFAEVIPEVVAGFDYSAKLLLRRLLDHKDITLRLGYRISRLLGTCISGQIEPGLAQRRAITCLSAIWSLTMMSLPSPSSLPQPAIQIYLSRDALRFDEHTLRFIELVRKTVPAANNHSISAGAVIARTLLDMFHEQSVSLEDELSNFIRAGTWSDRQQELRRVASKHPYRSIALVVKRTESKIKLFEYLLTEDKSMVSHSLYFLMNSVLQQLDEVVAAIPFEGSEHYASQYARKSLEYIRSFQTILNQVGYVLLLDFLEHIMERPHGSLPHEAFNTIRRLFIRLNFDSTSFSSASQARSVRFLDDALDLEQIYTRRLPESIMNIVFELVRGLDDLECISKAKGIISRYMKVFPANEAAQKALSVVETALPIHARPEVTLEIFSEHMYSNVKLVKTPAVASLESSEDRW